MLPGIRNEALRRPNSTALNVEQVQIKHLWKFEMKDLRIPAESGIQRAECSYRPTVSFYIPGVSLHP